MATVLCLAANSKRIYAVIADDKAPFGQTQRLFLARSQLQPSSIETNFQIITTKDYTYLGTDYSVDTKVSCAVAEELPSTQQDSIPSMAIMMARTAKRYTYRAYWGTMYTATNTTANNSTNTAPQSMAWKEIKSSMECPMDGDCDHQILAVPTTPAGFVHVTYRSSGNSVSASISAIKDWGFEDYSTIFRSPSKALGGSYLFGYSKDQLIVFQQAVHGQNDTITYSSFKIDSKSGLPSSKTPNTSEHISLSHCNDGLHRMGGNDGTSFQFWCRSNSTEGLYTYNHTSSAIVKLGNVQGAVNDTISWGETGPFYLPVPSEASTPWGLVHSGGLNLSEVRQTSLNAWQYNTTIRPMSLSGCTEPDPGWAVRSIENFFTRLGIRILIIAGIVILVIIGFVLWGMHKCTGLCRKAKRKSYVQMQPNVSEDKV